MQLSNTVDVKYKINTNGMNTVEMARMLKENRVNGFLKYVNECSVIEALSRNKLDDLKDGIGDTVVTLIILAQQHGMTLEECLQYAYDEIKGRKGKTINGTFIKESDL